MTYERIIVIGKVKDVADVVDGCAVIIRSSDMGIYVRKSLSVHKHFNRA